jgi:hypothetical protein
VDTAFKVPLKSDRARGELLDLFGCANGIGAFPRVVRSVTAAPISAYLNNQPIQAIGKTKKASGS